MDTITLIRSAIRGLLAVADADLAARLRAVLGSGDDYTTAGKPVIDWDDKPARDALVDSRARDGYALLTVLDGCRDLSEPVGQAMRLLATVLGQDLETGPDGILRIARRVAPDRVISTVDPEARHGHKTSHRGFDDYKGHIAVDRTARSSPRRRSPPTPAMPNPSPTSSSPCRGVRHQPAGTQPRRGDRIRQARGAPRSHVHIGRDQRAALTDIDTHPRTCGYGGRSCQRGQE